MIRPITHDEIETFCELADNPNRLHERLERMFEAKMSSPDFCHVLIENGEFVSGAVYFSFPASPGDFGLWDVLNMTEPEDLEASVQFLQQSFQLLTQFKAERIETQVGSLDEDAAERRALFAACGFHVLQVKARYEFDPDQNSVDAETVLRLETFKKLGKSTFVNLISEVTRNTLDRSQRTEYQRTGGEQWAENFYNLLLNIDPNQSCWRAAIVNRQPVGFVIPQLVAPDVGAINYIGVLPEHRGKGISIDLLKFGTAELVRAGVHSIIADIDIENFPLVKSLASIGYQKTSELDCYLIELTP